MTYTRHIPMAGVLNLRDLGGYPVPGGETTWRRTWRAASLHALTEAGIAELEAMGLGLVIDLRFADEIARQPNPFDGRGGLVRHAGVSLLAGLDPQNPEFSEAADPLLALYLKALETNPEGFVEVMRLIAGAGEGGVLFHCTAGKDRTGMIAAMLLEIAGVERARIVEDYVQTARHIGPFVEATRTFIEERGGSFEGYAPYLASEPETIERFLDHLAAEHGGARAYLARNGLPPEAFAALEARLGARVPQDGLA